MVRRRDPDDERRLRITLTPQGQAAVAADHVLDLEALDRALRQLPSDDRAELIRLLQQLADAAAEGG